MVHLKKHSGFLAKQASLKRLSNKVLLSVISIISIATALSHFDIMAMVVLELYNQENEVKSQILVYHNMQ